MPPTRYTSPRGRRPLNAAYCRVRAPSTLEYLGFHYPTHDEDVSSPLRASFLRAAGWCSRCLECGEGRVLVDGCDVSNQQKPGWWLPTCRPAVHRTIREHVCRQARHRDRPRRRGKRARAPSALPQGFDTTGRGTARKACGLMLLVTRPSSAGRGDECSLTA